MDEDYANGFRLGSYSLPCCGKPTTLNDLVYEWPQGFGRFAIVAMNPGIEKVSDRQKAELEKTLGTPLRVIYRR
jgi:hypothetical protein